MAFEAAFLVQSEEAIPCLDIPVVSACSLAHLYSDREKCGLGRLEKQTFSSVFACVSFVCFVSSQ